MSDDKKRTFRSKKVEISATLAAAMIHVKDFMTDPQKSHILYREGKLAMERGDHLGAIDCFGQGLSFNPMLTGLYLLRASCYKLLNMLTEAYFDYSFAIRLEPDNGSLYCSRALILAKLKKYGLGIEDADYAIELDPSAHNYFSRATIFSDRSFLDKAIEDYSHAINDVNVAAELKLRALYRRALTFFELSNFDACITDVSAILMLDPNHISARALMARGMKMIGELRKAEEQITNVITMENDQPTHFIERGDIRYRAGEKNKTIEAVYDFDNAIRLLERKIQRNQQQLWKKKTVANLRGLTSSASMSGVGTLHPSPSLPSVQFAANSVTTTTMTLGTDDDRRTLKQSSSMGGLSLGHSLAALQIPVIASSADLTTSIGTGIGTGTSPKVGFATPAVEGEVGTPISEDGPEVDARLGYGEGGSALAPVVGELEEQLAEALFRRAQSKLMIDCFNHNTSSFVDGILPGGHSRRSPELAMLEAALEDASKAVSLIPSDDDFQLLLSNCYIRLGRTLEAKRHLEIITNRSPGHQRAQFYYAICHQDEGRKRDAIEALTQIIANSDPSSADELRHSPGKVTVAVDGSVSKVPLGRLYETRGTLFHEIQVHKLALTDLGRAVAMDPLKPENYFLRGDCHSKLGNYEHAVADFNKALELGFKDYFSVYSNRGVVLRLMGKSELALQDFKKAAEDIDMMDRAGIVRVTTLTAFCMIDMQMYPEAVDLCEQALDHVRSFVEEARVHLSESVTSLESPAAKSRSYKLQQKSTRLAKSPVPGGGSVSASGRVSPSFSSSRSPSPLAFGTSPTASKPSSSQKARSGNNSAFAGAVLPPVAAAHAATMSSAPPMSLTASRKLEWILMYHQALSLYNQGFHEHVETVLSYCLHPSNGLYAPDEHCMYKVRFFLSLSLTRQNKLRFAEELMKECLESSWAISEGKQALCWFILGKQKQSESKHKEAIDCFSNMLVLENNNPYGYFRRAWSYKAVQQFLEAGSDFETAKSLCPDDPNFSIDYKGIFKCEYMQIDTEPDLVLLFPPLLPATV